MKEPRDYSKEITLDAANGVGALKVQKLLEQTHSLSPPPALDPCMATNLRGFSVLS